MDGMGQQYLSEMELKEEIALRKYLAPIGVPGMKHSDGRESW